MTLRRLTLRGVDFFELILIYPRKRIFQQTILACLSGAQVDSIHGGEKIPKISRDTTTLNDELLWSKTKNTYK